ncbi:MAG TPA: DNA polymerase III subunit chi [Rhizomicrobium sp.]|jgi:DNA polymerase-3 subunit chi|nr:DNA polymerase III subunit chi [Rhizomicrobium sp.]
MTETVFYHLERRALENVLPGLIEKSLERGWRAVIRTDSAERSDALDTLLWTYDDQSFLPHAQSGDGEAARQKVLITVEEDILNNAKILFCVGGAQPSNWGATQLSELARIVLLFDGRDGAALSGARQAWKAAMASGHDVTYWKESPSGKFEKQN